MRDMKHYIVKAFTVGAAVTFLLTGCGATSGTKTNNTDGASSTTAPGQETTAETTPDGSSADTDNAANKTASPEKADKIKAGNGDTAAANENTKIPVFKKGELAELKAYMAKLPDKYLSFEETKKLGIIRSSYLYDSKEEQKYFQEQWLSFYSNSKESNDIVKGRRDKDIGTTYEDAVIILRYTIEGDAIYDYISYYCSDASGKPFSNGKCYDYASYTGNGTYFLYSDVSRDKFGSGKGYHYSYNELIWHLNASGKKERSMDFYLVKNSNMDQKKLDKILESGADYNISEINSVYSLTDIPDTIDGEAIEY